MAYKQNSSDMTFRILELVKRLHEGQSLKIASLAQEFGRTERNFQRDFEKIREFFPLEKKNGGWVLEKKNFNDDDLKVLEILESFIASQDKIFQARAKKILSYAKLVENNNFHTKIFLEDISLHYEIVSLIESAISKRKIIDFTYKINDDNLSFTCKPLKIINDQGFWYMIAVQNQKIKKYHLKSISHVSLKDESFKVSKDIKTLLENAVNIWVDETCEPFEVRLLIAKEVVKYFQRQPICKTQRLEPLSDGSTELVVSITHEMEIIPLIKSWLPHIRVLEPLWIDEMIREDLEVYLQVCK